VREIGSLVTVGNPSCQKTTVFANSGELPQINKDDIKRSRTDNCRKTAFLLWTVYALRAIEDTRSSVRETGRLMTGSPAPAFAGPGNRRHTHGCFLAREFASTPAVQRYQINLSTSCSRLGVFAWPWLPVISPKVPSFTPESGALNCG
jgi:hypothetical protein